MNKFKDYTAEELMKIYTNGHPDEACMAFEELYSRYSERVYIYCLKRLQIKSDAEDVLQKVFLKLHECKHLFNDKYKFEQWIFVITKTSVIDLIRKQIRDVKKIEALLVEKEINLPVREEDKLVLSDLKGIDSEQMKLLELKYIDDLSYKEISTLMNKSEVSIRKSVSRLILKLKNGGYNE